jgi:hypothetical protein
MPLDGQTALCTTVMKTTVWLGSNPVGDESIKVCGARSQPDKCSVAYGRKVMLGEHVATLPSVLSLYQGVDRENAAVWRNCIAPGNKLPPRPFSLREMTVWAWREMVQERIAHYAGTHMAEVSPDQLKRAVEAQHGGRATHVQSVPVHESRNGQTIWNGAVQVYDLADSPSGATRAYAWSHGFPDGKRQLFAVLHAGPVTGPREAVRAIVAQSRAKK